MLAMNAMAATPQKPAEKDLSPMHSILVPAKEYPALVQDALAGSGDAAFRLSVHYSMTARVSEEIFWATIAAENGHQIAAFNLGAQLANSPNPKQRLRARYWLKKVVSSRDQQLSDSAKGVLKTLDKQERTNEANTAPRYGEYPKWPTD